MISETEKSLNNIIFIIKTEKKEILHNKLAVKIQI